MATETDIVRGRKTRQRASRTKLAVGYARRSTDRQEQSIGDQRRAVEAYALRNGCEIIDWYVDDAISGAGVAAREGFLRMIVDAQRPGCPFECVLVYDVKRFGRLDNDETGYYRHILKTAGVDVIYVAEGFNGDDTDDLLRPVKQWQARQELKDLSKVTIRGLLSKAAGGCWMGGIPPYGYDLAYHDSSGTFLHTVRYVTPSEKEILDADGNVVRRLGKGEGMSVSKSDRAHLVPSSPERVKLVKNVFAWYVREGLGYKGVAARLNEQSVPSPRGGKWSMTTVRDLLSNPNYAGDLVWNRRTMAKFNRVASGRAVPRGRIVQGAVDDNEQDDWVVTEGAHEALVDRDTFQAAQALRAKRQHSYERSYRRGRGAGSDYLLTGLVVCAHCGHNWQGYTQRKGRRRVDGSQVLTKYYACGGYVTKGTGVCSRSVMPKEVLEGQVFDAIAELVGRYVETSRGRGLLVSALRQALAADVVDAGELERLTQQRENIHRKINGILDNLTETNREFADARIRELKKDLRQVEPRLEELKAREKAQPDLDALADEILAYLGNFDEVLAEGTVDEKRRFIRAFVHQIVLEPGTLQARIALHDVPLPAV